MQLTATKSTTDLRTGKTDRRTVTITPEAYLRYCRIALARAKADPERIFVAWDSVSLRVYTDTVFMDLTSPLRYAAR